MKICLIKNYLFVLIVCSCLSANGQNSRFELSYGLGTNGQIQEAVDDYFYISNPLYILDESREAESSKLKYNITGKLFFNNQLFVRFIYGHYKAQNSYVYNSADLNGDFWNKHVIKNYNPGFGITKSFNKLNISSGIEVAFYKVNNYISYFEGSDVIRITDFGGQLLYTVNRKIESETLVEGGKGTAINGFLELGWSFHKRLGVGITMSYGYLWAEFGDEIVQSDEYKYSGNQSLNLPKYNIDVQYKKYKKKGISPPELSAFVSLKIGKFLKQKQ